MDYTLLPLFIFELFALSICYLAKSQKLKLKLSLAAWIVGLSAIFVNSLIQIIMCSIYSNYVSIYDWPLLTTPYWIVGGLTTWLFIFWRYQINVKSEIKENKIKQPNSGLAIASLILGICGAIPYAGFICSVLAIIFGSCRHKQSFGKAGLILGVILIVFSILTIVLLTCFAMGII